MASSANRTAFVNSMISFCNQYSLDGVDIDWEYPSTGTQANNFLLMMSSWQRPCTTSVSWLFISSENGTKPMICTRTVAQGWEAFGINQ